MYMGVILMAVIVDHKKKSAPHVYGGDPVNFPFSVP